MKALITGVNGFAGNYLAELLVHDGTEVVGIGRSPVFHPFRPLAADAIQYSTVDLSSNAEEIRRLLSAQRPDWIFHLAALSSPAQSIQRPEETYKNNWNGTLNLLEAIRKAGLVCRLLLVSSSQVYGRVPSGETVLETFPLLPETPYAASKAATELLAYQYWSSYGIEIVRVRPFNHTGPGQPSGYVCPDLARKVAEIESGLRPARLEVSGLKSLRDFTDVRDMVVAYRAALRSGRAGDAYNLCSGKIGSIESVVRELASMSKLPIEITEAAGSEEREHHRGIFGSNAKATQELSWQASIPFRQTLQEILNEWRCRTSRIGSFAQSELE